jgi:polyhydroxyalkanoate synthesis regulator phasin
MSRKPSEVQAELTESAHKVWLAGLGALAMAQEGAGKLFDTLVSRGKDVEARGSGMLKDARGRAEGVFSKVGKGVDEQVVGALHRMGVPTREDIATLNRRVESLTASVEKLRAKPKPPARPAAERHSRTSAS